MNILGHLRRCCCSQDTFKITVEVTGGPGFSFFKVSKNKIERYLKSLLSFGVSNGEENVAFKY